MPFPAYVPAELLEGLKEMGIEELFPVQEKVYPHVMAAFKGRVRYDVCVCSPTGSGKTLGYALPVVAALQGRVVKRLRGLIVVPRKELAVQVFKVFKILCGKAGLVAQAVTGQDSLRVDQARFINNTPDLLVATPSRLIEMLNTTEQFTLSSLRFLVLDEADLLLSDTTQDWLRITLASHGGDRVNEPLHRILCSATLTHNMAKLNQVSLQNPKQFMLSGDGSELTDVKRYGIPASLEEVVMDCGVEEEGRKLLSLRELLRKEEGTVLVFTKTTESAHRLARLLQLFGVAAEEFSGQLSTKERASVIQNLREGSSACAICSDALARGMDIDKVSLVINYEIPAYIQTYIHRVGRTARANRPGRALTLLEGPDDSTEFSNLRKKAHTLTTPTTIPPPPLAPADISLMSTNLKKLATLLKREAAGTVKQTQPIPSDISTLTLNVKSKLLKRKREVEEEGDEEGSDTEQSADGSDE